MEKPIDRIIRRLEELDLKKSAASKKAGLSSSFLSSLERNPNRSMNVENAEKLSKVLGKSPQWILFGTEDNKIGNKQDQFRIDVDILDDAILLTDQTLVSAKVKVSREDRIKLIAYHYEEALRDHGALPRSRHN